MKHSTSKSKGSLGGEKQSGNESFSGDIIDKDSELNNSDFLSVLEKKLALLINNNTEESFLLIDPLFKIIAFNKKFEEHHQLFRGRAIYKGDSLLDYVLTQDRIAELKQMYAKVLSGVPIDTEIEFPLANSTSHFFLIKHKPAFDEQNVCVGIFINVIDITEKKKTQEQLILNEKRYHSLVDNSVDVIVILSTESKLEYISPSFERMLGYNEKEAIQISIFDFLHPEDYSVLKRIMDTVLNSPGIAVSVPVVRYKHKKGTWIYIEATLINLLHDPAISGIIENLWDVTAQIEAERQKEFERKDKEALINSTEDLIWSVSKDFKLIAGNNAFVQMMKSTTGKIVQPGDDLLLKEFFAPDFILFWEELYKKALSGELLKTEFLRPITENKPEQLWLEIRFNRILDKEDIIGIACYARDITESKKAKEIIIKEKEFSDAIINTLPGIFYLFDSSGKFLRWNKNFENISGYSATEISTMRPDQFFSGEEKQYIIERIQKVFTDGISDAEADFVSKNGTKTPYYFTGTYALFEGNSCLVGMGIDMTERKKSEALIQKINTQLQTAQQIAHLGYWENDVINNEAFWSDEVYKICNISKDEKILPRETFAKLVHPDDKNIHRNGYGLSLANNPLEASEIRIVWKDGTIRHVLILSGTITDKDGNVIRILGTIQDITQLKENERKLIELNEQINKRVEELAISNAELEQFAYIASHDLQEPLRMVTSFLTQLEKKYKDHLDEKANQYIHFATDGAVRMRKIILDLLEYSQVGKKHFEFEEIDMNELVSETVHLKQTIIEETGATIHYEKLPVIFGRRTPVHQVLHNLISNALKYHKTGIKPVVIISSEDILTHWKFSVSDNGIGIDPMFFDKIFVLFQRLHNKDEYSGTGIGLAICKKIIDQHLGKIWVVSEAGKGSTFYFTINKFLNNIES